MAKYRKKLVVIEATQWFENGDHPEDFLTRIHTEMGASFMSEGKIVRYYRHPYISGEDRCGHCNEIMHIHGWIDIHENGRVVCPGDWIITDEKGEIYPCKPDIFEMTFDKEIDAEKAKSEAVRE